LPHSGCCIFPKRLSPLGGNPGERRHYFNVLQHEGDAVGGAAKASVTMVRGTGLEAGVQEEGRRLGGQGGRVTRKVSQKEPIDGYGDVDCIRIFGD